MAKKSRFNFRKLDNEYDFSSDNINVFLIVLDSSSSMSGEIDNVELGLRSYKNEFENFYEADSIAVGVSRFDSDYTPGPFRKVRELSTNYSTGGTTALCYSIVVGAEQLMTYIEDVATKTGTIPRGTFIFFSDGEPCEDHMTPSEAKAAISEMNYAGITTVFVAFGDAITSEFGKEIGFQATVDVRNRADLVRFMGQELSKSCKEQSQSMKALGSDFFSHAANESSDGYSNMTAQVLEDDTWFEDI